MAEEEERHKGLLTQKKKKTTTTVLYIFVTAAHVVKKLASEQLQLQLQLPVGPEGPAVVAGLVVLELEEAGAAEAAPA
jgi:hypothetical protein